MAHGFAGPVFGRLWCALQIFQTSAIFKILPDFQNFARFSKFCPVLKLTHFQKFWLIFKMLIHFQNFDLILKFGPIFKIFKQFSKIHITCFQNLDPFSKNWTILWILTYFQTLAASDSWLLNITLKCSECITWPKNHFTPLNLGIMTLKMRFDHSKVFFRPFCILGLILEGKTGEIFQTSFQSCKIKLFRPILNIKWHQKHPC